MSQQLDELFCVQTGETTCEVQSYSDLLDRVVDSCPEATVVLESQQWSRLAAIQLGNTTIHEASEFSGDALPFGPTETAQWVAYYWNNKAGCYDLAWVATWPAEDDE